jgi:hypothetical protein
LFCADVGADWELGPFESPTFAEPVQVEEPNRGPAWVSEILSAPDEFIDEKILEAYMAWDPADCPDPENEICPWDTFTTMYGPGGPGVPRDCADCVPEEFFPIHLCFNEVDNTVNGIPLRERMSLTPPTTFNPL